MAIAYIGLGSNLGDRFETIQCALNQLRETHGIAVRAVSSFYETEPLDYPDQAWFLNGVAEVQTELSPEALLEQLLAIEERLQRERVVRYGPRTIDLDLLLYDDRLSVTARLQLPHLRMHVRPFVLIPLGEIAPQVRHPLFGLTPAELYAALDQPAVVRPYAGALAIH